MTRAETVNKPGTVTRVWPKRKKQKNPRTNFGKSNLAEESGTILYVDNMSSGGYVDDEHSRERRNKSGHEFCSHERRILEHRAVPFVFLVALVADCFGLVCDQKEPGELFVGSKVTYVLLVQK